MDIANTDESELSGVVEGITMILKQSLNKLNMRQIMSKGLGLPTLTIVDEMNIMDINSKTT